MSGSIPQLTKAQVTQFRNLKQNKFRQQSRQFLLEGQRLCSELFKSSLTVNACITTLDDRDVEIPQGVPHFQASRTQLEQIAHSRNPQGIVCIANLPEPNSRPYPTGGKTVLLLDRIADPGNMGTIMRSALWFGVDDLVLSSGCVDPFNPKVVRSSMGAVCFLSLHQEPNPTDFLQAWTVGGGQVAALHMQGETLNRLSDHGGLLLVVGSEAHGVDENLLAQARPYKIDQVGEGESLNAAMATSIALYELNRKGATHAQN